jgi:DNA-binding response OmpR family regulator
MRILVVEDDRKVGAFLEQGLRDECFHVERAWDGPDALVKARASSFDIILLDFMLPQQSGIQVVADLRAHGDQTPVLMLTARDSGEEIRASLAAGANGLLGKPFRFDDLLARIHGLVAAH